MKLKGGETELLPQFTECKGILKLAAEHLLKDTCLAITYPISLSPNFAGFSEQLADLYFFNLSA